MTTEEYKDPKDLRDIPLDRLNYESNQLGHQFNEWNEFFNVQSAIRVKGALSKIDYSANPNKFSELERWCIFSNRFLIMDREHLSDYKLFTKEEVLKMIQDAFLEGFNSCRYNDENQTIHECENEYMTKKQNI